MSERPKSGLWNHHPNLPLPLSPIMDWPPRPMAWLRWISGYWLRFSSLVLQLLLAWAVFAWTLPQIETMATLAPGWIAGIWLRNVVLALAIYGGLHLWFYTFTAQGQQLKFDAREMVTDNGTFTFRDQVRDNMFWTMTSGVAVWTGWEVLYWWAAANGWSPMHTLMSNPGWFVISILLIPVWSSFHFYWIHRLLHWPPLYRLAHALHHRNINIGPWSGLSMHPVEHVLYLSSKMIHLIVLTHPVVFLFHSLKVALNPGFSHCGFEGIVMQGRQRMKAGDFFHQLHHRYFECNYGTAEMPWDRVFGSFHDGSDAATVATRARKRRMHTQ